MLLAMAGVVMAIGVVFLVVSSSERRLDRLDGDAEQQVLQAFDRMMKSAESLNVDALFANVDENDRGAMVSGGQMYLTRTAALERTRENFRNLTAVKYRVGERHVTLLAPEAAVLVVKGSADVTLTDGRSFTNPFVQTIVLVQRDGTWRVVHSHSSSPPVR